MLLCGYAAFAVIRGASKVQDIKQPLPSSVGDLAAAKLVWIKDAAGHLVLSGAFVAKREQNGDVQGKALLTGAGNNAAAKGEAEFEVSTNKTGGTESELEVSVRQLAPRHIIQLVRRRAAGGYLFLRSTWGRGIGNEGCSNQMTRRAPSAPNPRAEIKA